MDWTDLLTERDKAVFKISGYGRRAGFGQRPVLLIIDTSYGFCGDNREPVIESVRRYHNACGPQAWDAVDQMARLISAARSKRVPVVFSTSPAPRSDEFDRGRWRDKNPRHRENSDQANQIVAEIAPVAEDIVIFKSKPSVFFGTLLASYLVDLQADSVIVCGATTSGCVRATVVDAFSYNLKVSVVEDGTFDRGEASHWINLFDMDMKYADVVKAEDALSAIRLLPDGLFDDRFPFPRDS